MVRTLRNKSATKVPCTGSYGTARKKIKKRNVMTEIDSFRDIELHALPYDLPWDAG